MDRREDEPRSSSAEVRAFISGNGVWADIRDELELRLEMANIALGGLKDLNDILVTQGAVAELRFLIDLPDALADEVRLNEKKRIEKKEGTNA